MTNAEREDIINQNIALRAENANLKRGIVGMLTQATDKHVALTCEQANKTTIEAQLAIERAERKRLEAENDDLRTQIDLLQHELQHGSGRE